MAAAVLLFCLCYQLCYATLKFRDHTHKRAIFYLHEHLSTVYQLINNSKGSFSHLPIKYSSSFGTNEGALTY